MTSRLKYCTKMSFWCFVLLLENQTWWAMKWVICEFTLFLCFITSPVQNLSYENDLICIKTNLYGKHIFIGMVSYEDSFWHRENYSKMVYSPSIPCYPLLPSKAAGNIAAYILSCFGWKSLEIVLH